MTALGSVHMTAGQVDTLRALQEPVLHQDVTCR